MYQSQIYLVELLHSSHSELITSQKSPSENLTLYPHGIVSSPIINKTNAAWLEMAEDGFDGDQNRIVLYDLASGVRTVLTTFWTRSPECIVFSTDGDSIVGVVGDDARNKLFSIPLSDSSSREPTYLTSSYNASEPRALPSGQIAFLRSSTISPNELYITDSADPKPRKLSKITDGALDKKCLIPGESFYFLGSGGKVVQGWIYKPVRFDEHGEQSKGWPVLVWACLEVHLDVGN